MSFKFLVNLLVVNVVLFIACSAARGTIRQESTRQLNNAKQQSKLLTPGEVDNWVFEAADNETVIVNLTTNQFDSVIGLAKVNDDSEEVLFSIDKEGSNSGFSYRIKKAGKYKIRVHGYQMKGGGTYQLAVQRFPGKPIEIGEKATGKFDKNGRAGFFFNAKIGQNLVIDTPSQPLYVFNAAGEPVSYDWQTNLLIQADGEHLVSFNGRPGSKFKFSVRPAKQYKLELDQAKTLESERNTLNIWAIKTHPGQFRVITVSRSPNQATRLIFVPSIKPNTKSLETDNGWSEMQFVPVSSKGSSTTYAVVFGRKGTYQVQVFSRSKSKIEISMIDPTRVLHHNRTPKGKLAVGGSDFHGFEANAGDLVKTKLTSETFDCLLRLFDERGRMVAENDDWKQSKNSQISYMVTKPGIYRWQVASLGNGGGGDYELDFHEIKLKQLEIGKQDKGKLAERSTDYWTLDGASGEHVYINIKPSGFKASVEVYDTRGRRIAGASSNGIDGNSLIPLRFPADGPLTVWVSSRDRAGTYDIRVINADWD